MAASSYAWSTALPGVISYGAEAVVPTPGFENPENYQTDKTEAVRNGTVLRPEEFSVTWDDAFTEAALKNQTETDWMPGDTMFITVAGVPFDSEDIQGSFDALEARVSKNETAIAALDTRVTALEAAKTQAPPMAATPQPAQGHVTAEVRVTRPVQQAVPPGQQPPRTPPRHR